MSIAHRKIHKRPKPLAMACGADFSPCRTWRYSLTRVWNQAEPLLAVIGLNPSTADETKNDPTVTRCVQRARQCGAGGLVMLNIFAYRATEPAEMKRAADPWGERNDAALVAWTRDACLVLAAWGHHAAHLDREAEVLALLTDVPLYCLGVTKAGHPRHPLYVSEATKMQRFQR